MSEPRTPAEQELWLEICRSLNRAAYRLNTQPMMVESQEADRILALARECYSKEIDQLNKALALKLDAMPSGLSAGQSMQLEERVKKAEALVASYDRQDELIGTEFEGVDEVTEVIRLLKQERDQARAACAEMRQALVYARSKNHADNDGGRIECRGHECRVCEVIGKTLKLTWDE